MLFLKRFHVLLMSVLVSLAALWLFTGYISPACGQDSIQAIPSMGKGQYEVMMFTDYLCPPCMRIDTKAEPLFRELLATQKVKLIFVDVPFSAITPMYAKYYLYAVNAGTDKRDILHVRRVLFDAAQGRNIKFEEDLIRYLKEQKISWKAMNEKSIFPLWSAVTKEHKVDETPTCVIRYSSSDVKKYVGYIEVLEGLTKLKSHLSTAK